MASDDLTEKLASTFINSVSRREFLELSVGAVAYVSLGSLYVRMRRKPSRRADGIRFLPGLTTRHRAIAPAAVTPPSPPISPWDASNLKKTAMASGIMSMASTTEKTRSSCPPPITPASVTNAASLLRFFTLTDTHVYDKESPSQPFFLLMRDVAATIPGIPGITYTMLYTTQILDAAIQTVNALHQQNPFDCGLFLGDACNNSQYNELRWYLDVIDGKFITPSSGAHARSGHHRLPEALPGCGFG